MPINKQRTDNEILDLVGTAISQATGNLTTGYDADNNTFNFLSPQGEVIQSLSLAGKTLQINTNKGSHSQDLSTIAGDTVTSFSLAGNTLTLSTDKGTKSVDLSSLVTSGGGGSGGDTIASLSVAADVLSITTDKATHTVNLGGLGYLKDGITSFSSTLSGQDLTFTTNKGVTTITLPQSGTLLSPDTVNALSGTTGTPNATNKFVTNSDVRLTYVKPAGPTNSFTLGTPSNAAISSTGSAIIGGGGTMSVSGEGNGVIIGGDNNKIQQYAAAIVGGGTNLIGSNGYFGGMVGGVLNKQYGQRGGMVGGEWTENWGYASGTVGGGYNKILGGNQNAIVGGRQVVLSGGNNSVILGGFNWTSPSISEMVYVPQLYLFKNGGGVSMVSASGNRYLVTVTDAGKLAVDGVEIGGGSGSTTSALTDVEVNWDGTSFQLLKYKNNAYFGSTSFSIHRQIKSDEWTLNGFYEYRDVVVHQGKLYFCLENHTAVSYSEIPTSSTKWKLLNLTGYASSGSTSGTTSDVNKAYVDAADSNLQQQINNIPAPKVYTAGTGISISTDNIISATGGGSGTGYDDGPINQRVTSLENTITTKVDKEAGSRLITSGEITKLSGLRNYSAGTNITISTEGVISSTATGGSTYTLTGQAVNDVISPYGGVTPSMQGNGQVALNFGYQSVQEFHLTQDVLNKLNATYTLPVASTTTLGGVKAGTNISISPDGTISSTATGGSSYDDTALKGRVTTLENDINLKVEEVELVLDGNQLSVYTNTNGVSTITLPSGGGTGYDDTSIRNRVTTLESTSLTVTQKQKVDALTAALYKKTSSNTFIPYSSLYTCLSENAQDAVIIFNQNLYELSQSVEMVGGTLLGQGAYVTVYPGYQLKFANAKVYDLTISGPIRSTVGLVVLDRTNLLVSTVTVDAGTELAIADSKLTDSHIIVAGTLRLRAGTDLIRTSIETVGSGRVIDERAVAASSIIYAKNYSSVVDTPIPENGTVDIVSLTYQNTTDKVIGVRLMGHTGAGKSGGYVSSIVRVVSNRAIAFNYDTFRSSTKFNSVDLSAMDEIPPGGTVTYSLQLSWDNGSPRYRPEGSWLSLEVTNAVPANYVAPTGPVVPEEDGNPSTKG